MQSVLLVRYGEIMLKGLNRPLFEKKLVENIEKATADCGKTKIIRTRGRIFIEPQEEIDFNLLIEKTRKVFGIVSVSPAYKIDKDMDEIYKASLEATLESIRNHNVKTFKVEARRQDKSFHLISPEICKKVGAYILENTDEVSVDVHEPDFVVDVEIREHAYVYSRKIPAFGGMPVGTNGKAVLLLSGGIDSPAAGWMIAKRGVELEAVHFYSYPYTSERSKEKVIKLAKIVSGYCNKVTLHIVPFTDIQLEINDKCKIGLITVIGRRAMMRISQKIAKKRGAKALITGESVGQVASQTIEALHVTNSCVDLPVFRPLIGMDKNEVVKVAKKIGTYETSILPYEDCCTVFVAKHPVTRPKLKYVEKEEKNMEIEELIDEAIENTETIVL